MARKPVPRPTNEELAWALHDAMVDTLTQLSDVRRDCGHRSFWMQTARNINHIYDEEICRLGELTNITSGGVQRLVRANWHPLVRRLTDIFEGDDFFIDVNEVVKSDFAA